MNRGKAMNEYNAPDQFFASCDFYVSLGELEQICSKVSPDFANDKQYKIVSQAERDHEFGVGGYNRGRVVLLENNKPIIVSLQRIAWGTTSDDYQDYTNESMKKTFLLEKPGPDSFARKIFEAIKRVRSPNADKDSVMRCIKCGSTEFDPCCHYEYFTTGGDMEHVEWQHVCAECGAVNSSIQQACYGYDNEYSCPFPGCSNTFTS